MWQAAAQDQVACWTNHKIFHQFKIYCGWAGDGREMVTSVRVKVIMFELGSLGQGGQFGVKCVNVFRQFYQNWLARLRGELSGDIYDRDPPQQVMGEYSSKECLYLLMRVYFEVHLVWILVWWRTDRSNPGFLKILMLCWQAKWAIFREICQTYIERGVKGLFTRKCPMPPWVLWRIFHHDPSPSQALLCNNELGGKDGQ